MSYRLAELYLEDGAIVTWWGSEIECVSAIARLEREEKLSPREAAFALEKLDTLARSWHLVGPIETLRQTARRFLRVHPLRAADAMQLAAAFLAAEGQPPSIGFVCLDPRLSTAALREGFPLVDQSTLEELLPAT
ncbi:MAG: PIN domain-containing protein [Acidobacteriota bacterium]